MTYVKKHLLDQQIHSLVEALIIQRKKLSNMREGDPALKAEGQRLTDMQDQALKLLKVRNTIAAGE